MERKLRCKRCGKAKGARAFYRCRKASTGRAGWCKQCTRAANALWYQANPLKRVSQYGITAEDYRRMYAEQDGKCAICKRLDPSGHGLAVDHDHRTGRLRRLLCHVCNRGIGHFGDDPALLRAAADYVESYV